jgi:hypothetical protein
VAGPPDWRGLLDLLEAHDDEAYDDLWRVWVVRDSDMALLDARSETRSRYDDVVESAGDWRLPKPIRDALRNWRFDSANELLADASAILDQRTAIESAAAESGLTPPATLETAFGLPDGFVTAASEATAELEAIERYDTAVAMRPAAPDMLQLMGMWGTTPDADLARSRDLFASGDLAASSDAAGTAASVWVSAEDVGRGRIISIVTLIVAFLLGVAMFVVWLRARRRRRRRFAARWVGPGPYATLAATPDPTPPVVVGDEASRGAEQE